MVVFHSPVQRRRRTPGFSTSPAPPGPLDEDPDNIFNATPGPARSRSVDAASAAGPSGSSHVKPDAAGKSTDGKSAPGSAVLQQRLQQSLMMVAESPSSKLNAPDPFRPRKQLRRSPPVAMKAFDHPPRAQNKQSGIAITSIDEQEERAVDVPVASVSAGSPPAPSAKGKEKARSFDVAAKALFDSDRHDKAPAHTRGRQSVPASLQPSVFLTPQPSTSSHRRLLPSMQEEDVHRSAPMRPSTSNTSIASAPAGTHLNFSPGGASGKTATPVKSLAKIGRLAARNANLETKLSSVTAQLDAILQAHQELQEQYEYVNQEKAAALERVQKYELIANECEELIESHEQLQLTNQDLEGQRQNDIIELETLKEAMGKLKWKERKLRHELNIRRQEGIYKEFELQNEHLNPNLRELKIEKCNLQVVIADLRETISALQFEKNAQARILQAAQQDLVWYEEVTKTHQDDLSSLQKRLDKRTRAIAELEEEQRHLSQRLEEEMANNEQQNDRLKEAEERIVMLEKENAQGKDAQNQYIGSQTAVRRLEKEVKNLEARLADRNINLETQIQTLQAAFSDKETKLDQATVLHQNLFKKSDEQLKQSQKDVKALELELRLVEKERDQLKSSWDMHRRASRVFGDGPSQTEAEAGAGSALPPLTEHETHIDGVALAASPLGKRKRGKGREIQSDTESDENVSQDKEDAALSDSPAPQPARSKKVPKEAKVKQKSASQASRKPIQKQREIAESESDSDEQTKARPAKRKKQIKPTEETIKDDASSDSDNAPNQKQVKRKRRRTAIKSGVPAQFQKLLKDEAIQEAKARSKGGKKLAEPEPSELSESTSEDSDTVEVVSSPQVAMKTARLAKTPAQASQLSQSSKGPTSKQQSQPKTVVKTEKTAPADTSAKSVPSTGGSTLGVKKKITLHKSASSNFIWGSGSAGASQSAVSKALLDLPDILSPVVRR